MAGMKNGITGWLIHNGGTRTASMEAVDGAMMTAAKAIDMDLRLVPNNRLLPVLERDGQATLCQIDDQLPEPDFVLFWDKDAALGRHLEQMGYRLYNRAKSVALCDNKVRTHQALAGRGIPSPKTVYGPKVFFNQALSSAYYEAAEQLLGYPMVLKEAYGSFGLQVHLVRDREALRALVETLGARPFLLQEYVASSSGIDVRVIVVGGQVAGAVERRSTAEDFRSNVALGAQVRQVEPTEQQLALAIRAARVLGLDFCGVDFLVDERGQPLLCEVNSNVNFSGFGQATGIDFPTLLLSHICRERGLRR